MYASTENFVLPLSHDEVVHGKGSLLGKMPGDDWQQFANLRLLLAMQWAQPGKKLLFMGGELADAREWNHEGTLDWDLHDAPGHRGVRTLVADLNRLYAAEPALHRGDCDADGMRWVEGADAEQSVYAFLRLDPTGDGATGAGGHQRHARAAAQLPPRRAGRRHVAASCSTPTPTSTAAAASATAASVDTVPVDSHGFHHSLVLTLPPLGALLLAPDVDAEA